MHGAGYESVQLSPGLKSDDGCPDSSTCDLDDRLGLPFLLPGDRTSTKRDSTKAQIILGLVTDTRVGRETVLWNPISRRRSRSEERPRYGRARHHPDDPAEPLLSRPCSRPLSFATQKEFERTSIAIRSASAFRDKDSGFINFSRPLSTLHPLTPISQKPLEVLGEFPFTEELLDLQTPRIQPQLLPLSPISPKPLEVLGEVPEKKLSIQTKTVPRDDIGLPRTPSIAGTLAVARPIFEKYPSIKEENLSSIHAYQHHRRSRLWTLLPICMMRFGWRKTPEAPEVKRPEMKREISKQTEIRIVGGAPNSPKMPLTEDNLRTYEDIVGWIPKPLNRDLLPTPLQARGVSVTPFGNFQTQAAAKHLPTPLQTPRELRTPQFSTLVAQAFDKALPTPPISNSEYSEDLSPPLPPKSPLDAEPAYSPRFPHVLSICEVCRDPKATTAFPIRQCTSKCTHPPHTCIECIQKWISSCIEYKGWDKCICPECSQPLAHDDIKFFATEEVFLRYDEMAARAALSSIPNFYWCLSPHCSSGQVHPFALSINPTFVCNICSHTYCLNHPSTPYHCGLSCPEYDALLNPPPPQPPAIPPNQPPFPALTYYNSVSSPSSPPSTHQPTSSLAGISSTSASLIIAYRAAAEKTSQEKSDERLAKEIGKRCPNAFCGWWIEKNEGCDHMTCAKCAFEFCWECCAPFAPILRRGMKFHRGWCRYYG